MSAPMSAYPQVYDPHGPTSRRSWYSVSPDASADTCVLPPDMPHTHTPIHTSQFGFPAEIRREIDGPLLSLDIFVGTHIAYRFASSRCWRFWKVAEVEKW